MQSLIEEAAQRATEQVASLLTLVQLSFETGQARARELADATGKLIDPIATCCYGEARELLLRSDPNLSLALMALSMAARREPHCYGPTYAAMHEFLIAGLQEAVDLEFARELHDEREAGGPDVQPLKLSDG